MELDDLKKSWTEYDKKLSKNLKFNEELLKKMNLNSSKKELQKPLIYDLVSILFLIVIIIYVLVFSIQHINEIRFCIPGFLSIGISTIYLVFAIIRTNGFLNIDYYGSPIIKLQRDILRLKKQVLVFRKYEMILIPLLAIPLLPIASKALHNIDLYQNKTGLIVGLSVILLGAYPLTIWINKIVYDKKFKNTENLLAEIDKYDKVE